MSKRPDSSISRICDANFNRAKEGLRVCEEVARFVLNSRALTEEFKQARHSLDGLLRRLIKPEEAISCRNSGGDVGKTVYGRELSRGSINDIFFANIQRVKESIRVLEEFSKLARPKAALGFKDLRYDIYALEKKTAVAIAALRHSR